MPLGGSQKPRTNWWQSVGAGSYNWFSSVKSKAARQSAHEAVVKTRAKLSQARAKG